MSSDDRDHRWSNSDHHSFWPTPSSYDLNSKIMLSAVVSLSAVILIVFTFHLYARFALRRRRQRDQAFHGLPVVFRHPFQTPKRGLDPTVIASLPTFTVGDVASASGNNECAVCLSVLEEEEMVRELPNCEHVFHVECVDTWLTSCSTCPVCRSEVKPRLRLEPEPPEPREGLIGGDGDAPPPLNFPAESSSENKTVVGSSVSRLDSFKRILTRERSSNRINHSCADQDRVVDIERH